MQQWQVNQQAVLGEAVQLGEEHAWRGVAHIPWEPFYVYSYIFGELLVQALYAQYQQQGDSFVDRYIAFLSSGDSKSPEELVNVIGLDLKDPSLWQSGCDQIRRRIQQAKVLIAENNKTEITGQ